MIIEIIDKDKILHTAKVEVVPRKGEYVRYLLANDDFIEGVVDEVTHSLSANNQSVMLVLKPL